MARILVISPIPTAPIDSGNRARLNALLSEFMRAGHRIHFLYLNRFQEADLAQMQRQYDSFHLLQYRKKGFMRALAPHIYRLFHRHPKFIGMLDRMIAKRFAIGSQKPFRIDDWYDDRIDLKVKELLRDTAFDVVLVEYVYLSKVLELFPESTVKIIDTHDVFANRHQLYLEKNMNPVAFFTTEEEEKKGLDRAHIVLAIQDEDARYFRQLTKRKVITIGYRLPVVDNRPKVSYSSQGQMAQYLLYVGSNTVANQHAMDFFIESVWKHLLSEIRDVKLIVVGNICYYIAERYQLDGIELKYRVDDLEVFYRSDCVVINPIFIGTGLKIKNMEALYWARPLVTTSVGAQGLSAWIQKAFVVADTPEEMVSAIKRLYCSPHERQRLARGTLDFVKNYETQYANGISALMSLIEERRP